MVGSWGDDGERHTPSSSERRNPVRQKARRVATSTPVPQQSQPRRENAAQNGPHSHANGPAYTKVPDSCEIDEEARVRGEPSEEAGDDEKPGQIVRVVSSKRPTQEARGDEHADKIDGQQHPGNL